jgi:tRNA threonylcarbamoyladenosine biosynthesis protein TsaE
MAKRFLRGRTRNKVMKELRTNSPEETAAAAKELGELLEAGDIICLNGDLGAGKTAFTKGIAEALDIEGYITSPTFTIVNEYEGILPLYHFDVYRIADPDEMYDIGFEEYINGEGISVIEWSDLIRDAIPKEQIRVDIYKDLDIGNDARVIKIQFVGERYMERKRLYEDTCS